MPAGVEIERKFLVEQLPRELDSLPHEAIAQGYLALDGAVEVRVRRRGERAYLTVKSAGGLRRVEEELEIDARRFESLWALTEGRRVQKVRYVIGLPGEATLELDLYGGALAGLAVAEVEFDSEAASAAFAPPSWVGREVTDDPRYRNQALAVDGRPA